MSSTPRNPTPSRRRATAWLLTAAVLSIGVAMAVGGGQVSRAEVRGEASDAPAPPQREVLLLVDASEDVDPASWAALNAAAAAALDELVPTDLFNVIAFGSRPRALYPGSWPATPRTRDKARRFLDSLEVGGKRSLSPAVAAALAPTPDGYRPARLARDSVQLPRHVVLLTSRPADDAAELADARLGIPSGVRLAVIPATPAAVESVRRHLRPVDGAAADESSAGGAVHTPSVAIDSASASGPLTPRRALLLAALALPVFLGLLGWAVRRGLAAEPISG